MPYVNKADARAYARRYQKANREKVRTWNQKWIESHREAKRACNRRAAGEVGSEKRAAYNERRRLRRKAVLLREIEASRKHRESLREFITRKAA